VDTKLEEVCRRSGLEPLAASSHAPTGEVRCRSAAFDGAEVVVVAAPDVLEASIHQAAAEVPHLWPGREARDGALALLATSLQAVIEARREAPRSVRLSANGLWRATPAETFPPTDPPPSSWRAG
jgi:hypothetical protein